MGVEQRNHHFAPELSLVGRYLEVALVRLPVRPRLGVVPASRAVMANTRQVHLFDQFVPDRSIYLTHLYQMLFNND